MPAHPRVARPRPWLVLLLLAVTSAAHAQSSPFLQRGAPVARDTHTAFPYEHVDPLSGNLLLVTTDLALPGKAGFDLAITRVYNSKIHPRFEDQQDTTLEERSWVDVGWRLHFGRVINPSALTPGTTQIEMSDGSRHPLQTTTAFPEGWMTREFWRYDRTTHTLKLPTRPNGSGATRDVAVGAWGRLSTHVGSDPVIGGRGLVSVAAQSLQPGVPLDAEHAQYRDGWTVGPSTPPFRRRSGPGLP